MGDIKLYPATGTGTIKGKVNAAITGSGQEVDIDISGLKYATSSLRVTIPMFQGSTPTTVTTESGIANYSLSVPTGNLYAGTFSGTGTSYSQVSGGYFINAEAEHCTQSSQSTTELSVGPGEEVIAPDITFTGCSGNY